MCFVDVTALCSPGQAGPKVRQPGRAHSPAEPSRMRQTPKNRLGVSTSEHASCPSADRRSSFSPAVNAVPQSSLTIDTRPSCPPLSSSSKSPPGRIMAWSLVSQEYMTLMSYGWPSSSTKYAAVRGTRTSHPAPRSAATDTSRTQNFGLRRMFMAGTVGDTARDRSRQVTALLGSVGRVRPRPGADGGRGRQPARGRDRRCSGRGLGRSVRVERNPQPHPVAALHGRARLQSAVQDVGPFPQTDQALL